MVKKLALIICLLNLQTYAHEFKITYVTMAINLGRKDHIWAFQSAGKKYSFQADYLSNIIRILKLKWPVIVYIQKKYLSVIKPHLHEHAKVRFLEIEDLERTLYFPAVQKALNEKRLMGITAQGFFGSTYYRPLVMKKMDMLFEAALKNPFDTPYFVWIDANAWVKQFNKEKHSALVPELEDNRFIMHSGELSPGQDVWGMPRKAHDAYCGTVCTKAINGRILGGSLPAITQAYALYTYFLNLTLKHLHLGTEENLFTYCLYARPEYFNLKEYLYFHRALGYQGT